MVTFTKAKNGHIVIHLPDEVKADLASIKGRGRRTPAQTLALETERVYMLVEELANMAVEAGLNYTEEMATKQIDDRLAEAVDEYDETVKAQANKKYAALLIDVSDVDIAIKALERTRDAMEPLLKHKGNTQSFTARMSDGVKVTVKIAHPKSETE